MDGAFPADRSTPGPNTYVRLTLSQLWDSLPLILLAAGVFSLLCAPAVLLFYVGLFAPAVIVGALTITPSWVALLALEGAIVCEKRAGIGTMLQAWPRFWRRSVGLGLLASFPLLAGLLTLPNLARPEVPAIIWGGLAADGLGILVVLALSLYAIPLLVLHDMSLGMALHNALLLAGRYVVNTIGLLSMIIALAFAAYYVSLSLVFILPAMWGVFVVNNCRMVVAEELATTASERVQR